MLPLHAHRLGPPSTSKPHGSHTGCYDYCQPGHSRVLLHHILLNFHKLYSSYKTAVENIHKHTFAPNHINKCIKSSLTYICYGLFFKAVTQENVIILQQIICLRVDPWRCVDVKLVYQMQLCLLHLQGWPVMKTPTIKFKKT